MIIHGLPRVDSKKSIRNHQTLVNCPNNRPFKDTTTGGIGCRLLPETRRQMLRKPGCYAKANYANVPLQDLHPKLLHDSHDSHDRRPMLETPLYALKDGPLGAQGGPRQVDRWGWPACHILSPPKRTFWKTLQTSNRWGFCIDFDHWLFGS